MGNHWMYPCLLTICRELPTINDIVNDLTSVIENDNFVPEITPYLKLFSKTSNKIRDRIEKKQDQRKQQFDRHRRPLYLSPRDEVWVTIHPVSKSHSDITVQFVPNREGSCLILTQKSPTIYGVSRLDSSDEPLGTYHFSTLHPVQSRDPQPVSSTRRAQQHIPGSSSGRRRNQKGRL
ncbi:hypothetical protein AVEN_102654-1 [Araneus ventricosus]|uniref:Uncharacterized protein n=1 Tax=Araneus ventricosus TaxID=182803 RepID=A0A4Y2HYB9_ARAVE|nr:hypothetical protein AVEN_102654-1 [Araneus ventricosus]